MESVPLQVEHGIHHMLQQPWPGNHALFGHMPNQKDRQLAGLGQLPEAVRALPQLRHRSGTGIYRWVINSLNGVNDQQ